MNLCGLFIAGACLAWCGPGSSAAFRSIDNRTHLLGTGTTREWDLFAAKPVEGDRLIVNFPAHRNEKEFTLFIRQADVKEEWTVTLNGTKIGQLFLMEEEVVQSLAVPAGALLEGSNQLRIAGKSADDILITDISLFDDSKEHALSAGPIDLTVRDRSNGEPLPARIAIVDKKGFLTPVFDFGSVHLASRPGVVYTGTGTARVKLLPGSYTVYATRGPEYAGAVIRGFDPEKVSSLELKIERKADTHGWAAADTHIHSFSLSKHGDAMLRERMITLAGEGIELPVSTEHNQHADYQSAATAAGLDRYFTVIPGNEVTTQKGHFNIFPVSLTAKPPNPGIDGWPALMQAMRATPSVEVVVLNHPTDTHNGFTPFASTNFNRITGANLRGNFPFTFDAMEVINSGAMRSDYLEPFRAWFALLNRGYKIAGVAGSDSHDVSRFIVGQGRTYLRVNDRDVGHLDVSSACRALKEGHAVVSLGVIANLVMSDLDGAKIAGPGDSLSPRGSSIQVKATIDAPLVPGKTPRVTLYGNGVQTTVLPAHASSESHYVVQARIPRPLHDTYYVMIVEIDSNPAPAWGLARPYQPSSHHFDLRSLAATNPIWVDADGDGKFSAAREYASTLVAKTKGLDEDLLRTLGDFDYSAAAQAAELLHDRGENLEAPALRTALAHATSEIQRAFNDYRESLVPK